MPQAVMTALTSFFGALTGSSLAATVLAHVTVAGVTMVGANLLMPKLDFGSANTRQSLNVRGRNQRNATTNRQYIYGEVKVGGTVAYMGTSGTENQFLHMVLVHCDHEVEELGDLYVNGEKVLMASGGEGVLRTTSSATNRFYQSLYIADHLGGPGQTSADSTLDAATGDIDAQDAFKGMAYTYIRMELKQPSDANPDEENAFPSGVPQFQRVIKGMKVYDPREAGHSATDSTTWEYSANWALCVAHFLQSDFGYGRYGLTYDEINTTELTASANNSDEEINELWPAWQASENLRVAGYTRSIGSWLLTNTTGGISGTTQPDLTGLGVGDTVSDGLITWTLSHDGINTGVRYELNGMVDSHEDPIEVLRKMRTAASGMVEYVGGEWIVRSGRYIAPTVTINESDFASGISGTTKDDRTSAVNTVKGVIADKLDSYQVIDAPSVTNATFVTEDGGIESVREMELMYTNSHKTAQRLFKIELNKARQSITHKASFTSKAMQLQVGDNFQLNFAKYGYVNKVFEVWSHQLVVNNGALQVEMEFRETATNVYDWDHTTDETALDPSPNTTLPSPFTVPVGPTPTVTSGTATLVQTADGTILPSMHVSWTPVSDMNVIGYEVRFEKTAGVYKSVTINGRESSSTVFGSVLEFSTYPVEIRCITPLKIGLWGTATNHQVIGKSAAPSTPTNFSASAIINGVSLTMDAHPDIDFKRFLIYESTANSQPLTHSYTTTDTTKTINGLTAGTPYYFWLEAEDTTNHTSSATSSATATPDAADTGPAGPSGADAIGLIIPSYLEQVNSAYSDYDPVGKTITPTVLLGDATVSYNATPTNNTWRYKSGLTYTGGTAATTTGTGGLGFATHTDGTSKLEVDGVIIYRNASAVDTELDFTAQWVLSGQGVLGATGPTGPTGPAGADGADGADGTNGTDGADAKLEHNGLIYYTTPQASAPATPSASSYTFSTRSFTGLTSGWQTTPVEVVITDTTTKYWSARYDVTETTAGGNTGSPSFTAPAGTINFGDDIQSDNYVSGSSGWSIERDTGNAEFNDGTFRGELNIGNSDSNTVITATKMSFGDRLWLDNPASSQTRIRISSELSTAWPPSTTGEIANLTKDNIYLTAFRSGGANNHEFEVDVTPYVEFIRLERDITGSNNTRFYATPVSVSVGQPAGPGSSIGLNGNGLFYAPTGVTEFNIEDDVSNGVQLSWLGDTNLYRSASGVLKTDDSLTVAASLSVGQTAIDSTSTLSTRNDGTSAVLQIWRCDLGVSDRDMRIISPDTDSVDAPFVFSTNNSFLFSVDGIDSLEVGTTGNVNLNNAPLSGVNNLEFNDPGPNEGISWGGGNGWSIWESPDDLTTNSAGNLQFVDSGVRRLTINNGGAVVVPQGELQIGVSDSQQGVLNVFGGSTGGEGGEIRVYNNADDDTTYDYWRMDSDGAGRFRIGRQGETDMFFTQDGNAGLGNIAAATTKFHVEALTYSGAHINYDGTSNSEFGLRIESNASAGSFESDFANGTTAMLDLYANSTTTSGGDFLVARTKSATPVLLLKATGSLQINGTERLPATKPTVTDADTSHILSDFTDTEAACDELGAKINSILSYLNL